MSEANNEKIEAEFDCVSCGACCGSPDDKDEHWAGPLTVADYARLPGEVRGRLLSVEAPEEMAGLYMPNLRLADGNRCSCLVGAIGEKVSCTVYGWRPQLCQDFEPGGRVCRDVRVLRGVDPLIPGAQLVRNRRLSIGRID